MSKLSVHKNVDMLFCLTLAQYLEFDFPEGMARDPGLVNTSGFIILSWHQMAGLNEDLNWMTLFTRICTLIIIVIIIITTTTTTTIIIIIIIIVIIIKLSWIYLSSQQI